MAKWSKKIRAIVDPVGSTIVNRSKRSWFGKNYNKFASWGYAKKKLRLNKLFGSSSSAASYNQMMSDAYGQTGSIVGKY